MENLLLWRIDAKNKTISPINEFDKKNKNEFEVLKSIEFEENKPKHKIIGSICKSGIFISSDILHYTDGDMRPFKLNENNEAIILTK